MLIAYNQLKAWIEDIGLEKPGETIHECAKRRIEAAGWKKESAGWTKEGEPKGDYTQAVEDTNKIIEENIPKLDRLREEAKKKHPKKKARDALKMLIGEAFYKMEGNKYVISDKRGFDAYNAAVDKTLKPQGGGLRHRHRVKKGHRIKKDAESVVTEVSSVASSALPRPSRRVQMGDLEFR